MPTANNLLEIAVGELGTKESPAGSNRVKYASWYGLQGQPWCMMFVMWVFAQAGVALPTRTASCTTLMNAAKAAGDWVTADYQPGDVVIYDWGGDKVPDHCGIVESVSGSSVTAIEGNTSFSNDSNGGEVMRRVRQASSILGAVRPVYDKEETTMDNTPSAAHKEGVEWAVKNGILIGNKEGDLMLNSPITRQQMCTMLYRFAKYLGKV